MSAAVSPARVAATAVCLGLLIAGWAAPRAPAAFPGENGKIAFQTTRDGNTEIYTMNADGTGQVNRSTNAAFDGIPAWSPDGTKIAFVSTRDNGNQIYTMNADGTGQVNRSTNAAQDTAPAWSPDGTKIAFTSTRDGDAEIYTMNADGTGQANLSTNSAADNSPAWSPDGTKIAFNTDRDVNTEIYMMNADGTGQVNRSTNAAQDGEPAWSPDGTKIAFETNRDGNQEVYEMNADGTGQVNRSTNAAFDGEPAWSPDGTKIAFHTNRDGNFEIYEMNAADGTGQVNRSTNAASEQYPDWQPLISDRDGDALPDSWEENGVDVDGDGTPDLDLPAMGADPDHKDIFIEVDYMAGHHIDQAQIDPVTDAFKQAPVGNPDGQGGITLHVDNGPGSTMDPVSGSSWGGLSDQDMLTHQNVLGSDFTVNGDTRYDWSEFESIRQTKLLAIRRPAFHYVIAAHSGPGQDFAGISRGVTNGASDFMIAMHENCQDDPPPPLSTECASVDPEFAAATFMHELGHNLGLQHGGTDEDAQKPNYLSVMNYNFGWGLIAFDGVTPTSTKFELDYSRFNLPLDENRLNEQRGFGIDSGDLSAFKTVFTCPDGTTQYSIPLTTTNVDWNCDRTIFGSTGNVSSDASGNGVIGQLTGPIDWNRLVFSGGGIGALSQPPGADDTLMNEPTPVELQESRDLLEHGSPPPIDPPAKPKPPNAKPRPRNEFSFGKLKRNKRKGTAKLTVNVPGPGALELAQDKKVKGDQARAESAGDTTLTVKPKGKAKKKLSQHGKAKLGAEVTYTPDGGDPSTLTASVKLVRK